MSSSVALREIFTLGRPLVQQWLEVGEQISALRDVATAKGLDWSQVKALLKAQIQDELDETGNGKRVRRIVEKAEFASAYADMLGLGNMNEKKYSEETNSPQDGPVNPVHAKPAPSESKGGTISEPIHEPAPSSLDAAEPDETVAPPSVSSGDHSPSAVLPPQSTAPEPLPQDTHGSGAPPFQAKASEDNGIYQARFEGHDVTGDASRPSVGGDSDAPFTPPAFVPAFLHKDKPYLLRPHCRRPELCGGYGAKHCGTCERASRESEAA